MGIVDQVAHFEESPPEELLATEDRRTNVTAPFFTLLRTQKTYFLRRDDKHYSAYAELLRRRVASLEPIFVETEPSTDRVVRLLNPKIRRIADIAEVEEGYVVRPTASPMLLLLSRHHPEAGDYKRLLDLAKGAESGLLITDDPDTHEILDVRHPFRGVEGGGGPPPGLLDLQTLPPPTIETLSLRQARVAFNFLASQSHIPFEYPDDCCTSRAHEMCRLLIKSNIQCRKIWNFASSGNPMDSLIRFFTVDHPSGFVPWTLHVAPLVQVQLPRTVEPVVLDPIMFSRPALIDEWIALQRDDTAIQLTTAPNIYFQLYNGAEIQLDDRFLETTGGLTDHFEDLILRRAQLQP